MNRSPIRRAPPARKEATQSTAVARPRPIAAGGGLLAQLDTDLVLPGDFAPSSAAGRRHMGRVADLGCLICRRLGRGWIACEVHHIRTGVGGAERAPDQLTVGLCRPHHQGPDGIHGLGLRGFERRYHVDELGLLAETISELTEGAT